MQRHITDLSRQSSETGRAAAYARIERSLRPHPTSLQLQHRARKGSMDMRLKQFLRVARGHTA